MNGELTCQAAFVAVRGRAYLPFIAKRKRFFIDLPVRALQKKPRHSVCTAFGIAFTQR
jgi:hypothetical protein